MFTHHSSNSYLNVMRSKNEKYLGVEGGGGNLIYGFSTAARTGVKSDNNEFDIIQQ